MTITVDELRKLLDAATPGPWVWREDELGSHNLVHWVEGETFATGSPRYIEVHSDGSANGEYGPSIDVDGPEAALIALAPYLARRVIAAEKLVDALRECMGAVLYPEDRDGYETRDEMLASHAKDRDLAVAAYPLAINAEEAVAMALRQAKSVINGATKRMEDRNATARAALAEYEATTNAQ